MQFSHILELFCGLLQKMMLKFKLECFYSSSKSLLVHPQMIFFQLITFINKKSPKAKENNCKQTPTSTTENCNNVMNRWTKLSEDSI